MKEKYGINFTKAVGSGNDFIILDNKNGALDRKKLNYKKIAMDLCRQHLAIGADGILVLEKSKKADFRMRIINPDGSEVTMCGNGARCSALYASKKGWGNKLSFETGAGVISAEVKGDSVKLKMSDPKDIKLGLDLCVGDERLEAHFINTGVPHVVCFVKKLEGYPVKETGCTIRYHELFSPKGTNANFVGGVADKNIAVRTYERGVEDETLACGTGSVASAVIAGLLNKVKSPVTVLTKSGEKVKVYFKISGEKVTEVYLEGKANLIFEGRV
ncbi:MAG TPA: diaminopimelate epimerase [Candidatus Omnitrophota bacterium]|nr:diaminopimelate epimerase [Candidatus Omnitrophota bacterium]HPS20701.1 diaminopimelate epimerase [Candidatus Omnitrophota bacterium]